MKQNRIAYLDAAKGLCMILVVMIHTGVPEPLPGLYCMKVILFFILSGYFFSCNMSTRDMVKKKVRTILVPFIVFYVASYAVFYGMKLALGDVSQYTTAQGITDCFTQNGYFNGPLWFLLSLFEINFIILIINKLFGGGGKICQWIVYIILFLIGYLLSIKKIDLPLDIDTSLTATIFFAIGMECRKWTLFDSVNKWKSLTLGIVLYVVCLFFPVGINMSVNRYDVDSCLHLLVVPTMLSFSLIMLCKAVLDYDSKYNLFAIVGRHTLFILCAHHLVYRPIKMLCVKLMPQVDGVIVNWTVFLSTIILCTIVAPWFERHLWWCLGRKRLN